MSLTTLPSITSTNQSSKVTNYKDLFNAVKEQNELLEFETTKLNNVYSTNNREASFTYPKYQWYVRINFFLWITYYILVLVSLYYLYFKNTTLSNVSKHMICIVFLIYPMFIFTIENLIYRLITYLFSLFSGIPYKSEKNNKPPLSILNLFPPGTY